MGETFTEIGWFFVVDTEEGDAFGSDMLPYRHWVSSFPPPQWCVSVCHSLITYLRVIHGSPHDLDV